jgi:maleate isomerase
MPDLIRAGLLVPAGNTTFEADFASVRPEGVTLHGHRIAARGEYAAECMEAMDDINSCVPEGCRMLARAGMHAIAYGFTTASFYRGVAYARGLVGQMAEASGARAFVPSLAVLEALEFLGARKISVCTPYPEWNNEVLAGFLAETEFEVLNLDGDPRLTDEAAAGGWMWHQDPTGAARFVGDHCHPDADVVLCPCTSWRVFEVVDEIERSCGRPVVTANQATIWQVFRDLRIPLALSDRGELFRRAL